MKKSILISALLLCIAPSVFGQQKTAYQTRNSVREEAQDIPDIKNDIKNKFLKWAKKGEFELSKEHFERIQSERVKKLHQLTAYEFENRVKPRIYIDLGTYNADEKIYPITITISRFSRYSILVEKNIPLEREEATKLKDYIIYNKYGPIKYGLEKDPNNWFVKDGFLFPIDLEYEKGILKNIFDKENYPLFSEYVFNTDDLGLSEYFPENYTFTLKEVRQEDELKKAAKEETERIRKEEEQREKAQAIIPSIKDYAEEDFLEWAEKGEFESNKKHFKRIQSKRVKILKTLLTNYFILRESPKIRIELGTYNADEKIYPITITQEYGGYTILSVKANVPIEIEKATEFKSSIESQDYNFLERDPDNWFVKDGFLFPINVEYSDKEILKKILDKGDYPLFSEYVFNTDDLGLSEYFPENYTFTLKDYIESRKKAEKEQKND